MGTDKALLPAAGGFLVERIAAEVAGAVDGGATLVGNPEKYAWLRLPCLRDSRPGNGPMGGIEAALQSGLTDFNLIVTCDTPDARATWLKRLVEHARRTGTLCTVTRDATGRIHPLCAVYRRGCLETVRRALDEGRRRAMDLVRELDAAVFDLAESLANLNTPAEWSAWREGRPEL
jgi:molybdopterin-guanine dinucleotide biosynthesis protein A